MKVKNREEKISINNQNKHTMYKKKWHQVENVLKTKAFDILPDLIQPLSRGVGGGVVGL